MPPWRVLVICEGNLARSPLTAALLQRQWPQAQCGRVVVESAGTRAHADEPVAEQMRSVAEDLGLELGLHRSRLPSRELLHGSDLVLTMTEQQRSEVQRLLPSATGRIFTLVEFIRLLGASRQDIDGTLPQIVRTAHLARPRCVGPAAPEDIEDPYGRKDAVFSRVAERLRGLIGELTDMLSEPGRVPANPDPSPGPISASPPPRAPHRG